MIVSSLINIFTSFSPDEFDTDLNGKDGTGWLGNTLQYSNSKLLQIHLSDALARQFEDEGAHTESVTVHPGKINPKAPILFICKHDFV